MPWFVVDDSAHMHPKLLAATNAGLGLWLRCGSYAAQHLTDGIVPAHVAKMYGTPGQIRKLVAAGLWHEHGHTCPHSKCAQPAPGDFYMHDYLDPYNPSRVEVENRRRREAEKKQRYRARGEQLPLDEPDRTPPPPRPRRDEAGPIPAGWQPSDADVQAAQLARADVGAPQLTPQQLDTVTRRFVRRMTDDQVRAATWGGRWQGWAERERAESPSAGNVVQLGALTKSQQQRAGLDRLRQNGGHSA
ncbi:hypothetical protein [Streptomyces sp. A13(2022)]|uniref:hypothetical protein n=1 Tax=Streptomyces sp. A13(2022) TaxID=2964768 RepID=UPI0021DA7306|nr:hypothetical protein [Streptomyces sp. A13(2022)]MCU8589339.1 hypothetical protein [Streptomyces sp. A13(2022)]